jgi:hypothetical protein
VRGAERSDGELVLGGSRGDSAAQRALADLCETATSDAGVEALKRRACANRTTAPR